MYGFLISLGGILAFFISEHEVKKRSLSTKFFYRTVNFAIIAGILGARLYHVLDYFELYRQNPRAILAVWRGGLGIFGAILGGLFAIHLSARLSKENLLKWLDIFVLGLPLAQAIGRWGNFFNRELLGVNAHPLFLYESILNGVLFLVLLFLNRKNLPKGTLFYTYILGYGAIRFFLEFLRMRAWTICNVNVTQAIALIMISGGLWGLWRKNKNCSPNSQRANMKT